MMYYNTIEIFNIKENAPYVDEYQVCICWDYDGPECTKGIYLQTLGM